MVLAGISLVLGTYLYIEKPEMRRLLATMAGCIGAAILIGLLVISI